MSSKISCLASLRNYRLWTTTQEIPLTLLAIFWFLLCTFLACLANAYLDAINPYVHVPIGQRIRMPDPLLEALYPVYNRLGFAWNFPDPLARCSPMIMFLRVILGGKEGCFIIRRLGYMVGTGYLIRIPFVLMTMLPNPLLTCTIDPNPSLLIYTLELMAQLKATCGDVIFSGHTIMFMSASLVWVENPIAWFPSKATQFINALTISFSIFGTFIMVASTYHYTVDCVLSVLTMLFLWKSYHFMIRTRYFDDNSFVKFIVWIDGRRYTSDFKTPVLLSSELEAQI